MPRRTSTFGQSVSFTAAVTPSAAIGTVQFVVDGVDFGSAVSLSGGTAVSVSTSALSAGSHSIAASFIGVQGFAGSNGGLNGGQTVSAASTTTSVTSSPNAVTFGQSVSFTATVAPSTANGTFQFAIDGVTFGSPVPVSGGTAVSGATSASSTGNHTITASFTDTDGNYTNSNNGLSLVVGPAPPACVSNLGGAGKAGRRSGATVTLSWSGMPSAVSYEVLRSASSVGPFSEVGAPTKATAFTDQTAGLVNGDTYYYELQPLDGNGASLCTSNEATIAIP